MEQFISEFVGVFAQFIQNEVLPILDPLYIASVIGGSYLLLKALNFLNIVRNHKETTVFIFATLVSFLYVGLDILVGKELDVKHALFINFVNYCIATSLYEIVIKGIRKVAKKVME